MLYMLQEPSILIFGISLANNTKTDVLRETVSYKKDIKPNK